MEEYRGTIVEQSLSNKEVLSEFTILRTYTDEDWTLHDVCVGESSVKVLQTSIADGPWYIHLWNDSKIVCIFKNKLFKMDRNDKNTWEDAIDYGVTIGIPEVQMDFVIPEPVK